MENNKLDFQSILSRIEAGFDGSINGLDEKINEAFNKTVKRVLASNKKGVLTIKLTFGTLNNNKVAIRAEIETKLPEPEADAKFFYHDLKGNLTENDPMQPQLFENVKPLKRVNQGEAQQ